MADTLMSAADLEEEDEKLIPLTTTTTSAMADTPMSPADLEEDDDEPIRPNRRSLPTAPEELCRFDPAPNSFASDIITVLVGKDEIKYSVHKEKLVASSPVFSTMLAIGMQEAQTNIIRLPEETCGFFNECLVWMYYDTANEIESEHESDQAIEAWTRAQKYMMHQWQNALVDAIIGFWQVWPLELRHVRWARADLNRDLLISRLIIDMFAYQLVKQKGYYRGRDDEINSLVNEEFVSATELKEFAYGEKRNPIKRLGDYHCKVDEMRGNN